MYTYLFKSYNWMFLIQLFRDIVFVYVLKLPLTKSGDGLFIKILLNLKIKIYVMYIHSEDINF